MISPATARSTGRWPVTATGVRPLSRWIRPSRSSHSVPCATPGRAGATCSRTRIPGSVAVAQTGRAGPAADHARQRVRGAGWLARLRRCCGSSRTWCRCSTPSTARGSSWEATSTCREPPGTRDSWLALRPSSRAIRSLGLVEAKTLAAHPPASSPDCPCGSGGSCDHVPTWGAAELDHLFVSPVAGRTGPGRVGGRDRGHRRPVRSRAAADRPGALTGAHAPRLGRGGVRRGDRAPARTSVPATSSSGS